MTPSSRTSWTLPPIVHALRDATRDAHDRLDADNAIVQPGIDLATYCTILRRYLRAHGAVELALQPWAPSLASMAVVLDERRKVPLLMRDLGVAGSLLGLHQYDDSRESDFALTSLGSAWGALYVVEGSTLGGQHILRSLQKSPLVERHGLSPDAGLSYFSGYDDRTGDMWRSFLGSLGDADAADPGSRHRVIEGAKDTFALFERALAHRQSPSFAQEATKKKGAEEAEEEIRGQARVK